MTKKDSRTRSHKFEYLVGILVVVLLTCCALIWNENNRYLAFQDNRGPTVTYSFRTAGAALDQVPKQRHRMSKEIWAPYLQEVLDGFPANYSSEFRNPCWYKDNKLHCVPYFYQLGSYKCGTTDIWDKLTQHPNVLPVAKEPHWWAWRRLGFKYTPIHKELILKNRRKTGQSDDHSVQWYFNFFQIQGIGDIVKNPKLIFGDASISNLWGLGIYYWEDRFPNQNDPPVFLADLIHAVQPHAKITVILRDPVEKMWTTYMLEGWKRNVSPEAFHHYFKRTYYESQQCESRHSPSYCAFMHGVAPDSSLDNLLYQGIYYLYLREWVDVFGLENIHVMRLEDWIQNPSGVLEELIRYLEIEPLSRETIESIVNRSTKNVNEKAKLRNFTMLPSTRRELEDFYRPWNQQLAELLEDPKYTWGY